MRTLGKDGENTSPSWMCMSAASACSPVATSMKSSLVGFSSLGQTYDEDCLISSSLEPPSHFGLACIAPDLTLVRRLLQLYLMVESGD